MIEDVTHPRTFRRLRERHGVSQQKVADHLDVSRTAVYLFEKRGEHLSLAKVMRAVRFIREGAA